MLKKIGWATFMITAVVAIGVLLIIIFPSQRKMVGESPNSNQAQTKDNSSIKVVENFWKFSLEGNQEKLNEVLRKAPEEFFVNCSVKLLQSDEISQVEANKSDSQPISASATRSSESISNDQYMLIGVLSESIKRAKLKLFKVEEMRNNDKESIVSIWYGRETDANRTLSQNVLLYKENDKWRIFMITNNTEMFKYNKDFAKDQECP